jgi:pimeloyl-ACP methyl ester carboxylesterase
MAAMPAAGGGGAGESGAAGAVGSAPDPLCPTVVADTDCDKSQRPFVFVHGTYGSGDNIAHVANLFGSNGYCQDRFVSVEYNSVANTDPSALIDAVVDAVLAKTGADKVDLAGHSQGTYQCTRYLQQAARAGKVAHYINLSGGVTVPNDVETLSISSENDLGGGPAHATNAMQRVTYDELDHMGLASSTEAFVDIWKYLHGGQMPQHTTVQCGADPITIEAIVETFADNQPISGAKVEAFEVTATPREQGSAYATQTSDAKGQVAPFQLKRNVQYELQATDSAGKLLTRTYYTPFKRSNHLVRLLAPSGDPNTLESSTGQVASGAGFSALLTRYLGGAFRHDLNETLSVIGSNDLLSDMTAGRTMVSVGLYLSDQNENGMSDYGQSFTSSFLVGTDVFIDAAAPAFIELSWKDPFGVETKLKVPNWPSTEGILAVMLP